MYNLTDIYRGKGYRSKFIYAVITNETGLCVSATLDYCLDWLKKKDSKNYYKYLEVANKFYKLNNIS